MSPRLERDLARVARSALPKRHAIGIQRRHLEEGGTYASSRSTRNLSPTNSALNFA